MLQKDPREGGGRATSTQSDAVMLSAVKLSGVLLSGVMDGCRTARMRRSSASVVGCVCRHLLVGLNAYA